MTLEEATREVLTSHCGRSRCFIESPTCHQCRAQASDLAERIRQGLVAVWDEDLNFADLKRVFIGAFQKREL